MGVLQDGKWQNANSSQHGLADVRAATLKGFAAGDVVTPALRLKSYKMYFFFFLFVCVNGNIGIIPIFIRGEAANSPLPLSFAILPSLL